MSKPLSEYNKKRNFKLTSEPAGEVPAGKKRPHALSFVIQKHDARRLHYDFRLGLDGTLKSWAIPKGPSLDPKDKRLAVHVEDHPLSYATFEGSIPHGQYGGGDVIVWDRGVWQPHGNPVAGYAAGKLKFSLVGEKLTGDWNLVRAHLPGNSDKQQWLLIKERDESARPASEYDIVTAQPQSVITGAELSLKKSKAAAAVKSVKSTAASTSARASTKVSKISIPEVEPKPAKAAKPSEKTDKKKATAKLAKSPAKLSKSLDSTLGTTSKIPDMFTPELATLVSEPPAGEWVYEIKFDGYRILTRVRNGEVRLITRNGNDWTDRLPQQTKAIETLALGDSWLDGEVVVVNDRGLPDFQALQNAFDVGRSHNIIYYLFDAPFLNGRDLREVPLEERRAELEKVVNSADNGKGLLRFSAVFEEDHQQILASACAMSLEGVIGKRAGSFYVSRRSSDWIKLKCRLRQEFVIVGFTKPQGSRTGFGALLVAVHKQVGKPELLYAGRVGTGFNEELLQKLYQRMKSLARKDSPLSEAVTSAQARSVQWIEPRLICEVEFAEWTGDGVLRQAAFIALREDKPVKDIIRELPRSPDQIKATPEPGEMSGKTPPVAAATPAKKGSKIAAKSRKKISDSQDADNIVTKIAITHPDRIIDPQSGGTKKDLAAFYAEISPHILAHLNDRAVSILRAPDGITGQQFFQKHTEHLSIPHIKHLDPALDPGHAALMEIDSVQALVGAVQMGTIELHTWGSKIESIETPDRIILDLDPDPALPWRSVVEATQLTLSVLDELKLEAFSKTTGGKGMHIVIPLAPEANWDYVKEFSKSIAQFMANKIPERFVAKMGPKNRIGKIFIDYLRNQRGASTVSAFSVRARPGLTVSVPITRDELLTLTGPAQWHIFNLHERLESLQTDPWKGYKNRQRIKPVMWDKLGATQP